VRIRLSLLLGLFAYLSISSTALALDITGQSRSYLMDRETADTTRTMPFYEYLNFKVDNSARDSVSFNFGGWYRHDLKSESYNGRSNDDLQYAYLSLKKAAGNTTVDLGRVLVHEGPASERLDGVHARTDLKGGFTIAAYGGSPVETQFDTRRADSIWGGRIANGVPGYFVLGVSHLDEKNNGESFRREDGVDIWLRPVSKLEVQGMSSYNALNGIDRSRGWMQHSYYVTVGPFADLRLNGEFSKINYRQFFTSMTVSAFTFPFVDPNETVTTKGGSIDYSLTRKLTAVADYKDFHYRIAGPAKYYGGKIFFTDDSFGTGVTGHRMHGDTDTLRYDELGIYATGKIAPFDLSVQLDHLIYKQEINGVKNADNASAALGYALTPKARIVADVKYTRDPQYTRNVQGMATFVYSFDEHLTSAPPAANKSGIRSK
jgi:hypothetical protein